MKHEVKLTILTAGILAFGITWSAVNCFLTAFDLALACQTSLLLACGLTAIGSALLLSLRRGGIAVLGLMALAAGYVWRDGTALKQLYQLLHYLTAIYNRPYGWGIFPLPEGMYPDLTFDHLLIIWAVILTATVTYSICRRKSAVLPVLAAVLPLCTCIVVTDTVPGEGWLMALLAGLVLLALTAPVRQEDAFQGLWLTVAAAPAVILALVALFLAFPQDSYVNQSAVLRENILLAVQNVPRFLDTGMTQLSSKIQPRPAKQVNLSSLGTRIPFTYPVMTVTAETDGTVYLRGRDYDVYDGLSWQTTENRKESFSCPDGSVLQITVTAEDRKAFRFLPYYPTEETTLTGGLAENPGNVRRYSFDMTMLPENWREIAYQGNTSSQDFGDYLSLPEPTRQEAAAFLEHLYPAGVSNTAKADIIAALVTDSALYDLSAPKMPESEEDFALWFLREGNQGYCVHFATAATVLLRAAGVPARYVTGYMLEAVSGEAVTVTEEDAHAWAEYYEPNLGLWLPLEATPSAVSIPETLPARPVPTVPTVSDEPKPAIPRPTLETTPPAVSAEPDIPAPLPDLPVQQETPGAPPLWILLIPLILLIPAAQRTLRLKLRRKRQRTGDANVQALYRWREILRLSRLLKEEAPEELLQLAQKAKFSQYQLTPEELAQFDGFHRSSLRRLREKPWYLRMIYRYIYAVY